MNARTSLLRQTERKGAVNRMAVRICSARDFGKLEEEVQLEFVPSLFFLLAVISVSKCSLIVAKSISEGGSRLAQGKDMAVDAGNTNHMLDRKREVLRTTFRFKMVVFRVPSAGCRHRKDIGSSFDVPLRDVSRCGCPC